MSVLKFSEYIQEAVGVPIAIALASDELIVEWDESDWYNLTVAERAELEAESQGWAVWHVGSDLGDDDKDDEGEDGQFIVYEGEKMFEFIETFPDEDETFTEETFVQEYKARNTMQRRKTQKVKDVGKFKNRQVKLKAKIDRKKGSNKVRRLKVRKKWMKKNRAKIKNAQKVYGGKVRSKFTKKK